MLSQLRKCVHVHMQLNFTGVFKLKHVQYSCLWKPAFDRAILLVEAVTVLLLLTYLPFERTVCLNIININVMFSECNNDVLCQ